MEKQYTTGHKILAFETISKNLLLSNNSRTLAFETTSKDLLLSNNSKTLSFKLNDYDQSIPAFQIILEFIMETGGVF